jgi:chromosome segregation ATPase
MRDQTPTSPPWNRRCLGALWYLIVFVLGANQAGALAGTYQPAPVSPLAQREPLGSEQHMPVAELDQILRATQAKLEELSDAMAILAQEQASARHTELENSNELANARIAELTKALAAAVQEASDLDEELARLRGKNAQLEESVARAHAAREDSEAKAAELTGLREALEAAGQELATAASTRQQVETRVSELEEVVERSSAESDYLKTELRDAKEQLDQAVGAVVQAERARQAASSEVESLRAEAEGAREELSAARTEIERFKTANTELRQLAASWHVASRSAVELARYNLILMDEKIEELDAALAVAREAPTRRPRPNQDPADDEGSSGTAVPSTMAPQASAPELAAKTDARRPADSATDLSIYPIGEQ